MSVLFVVGVTDRCQMGVEPDKEGNILYLHDGNIPGLDQLPFRKGIADGVVIFPKNQPHLGLPRKPSLLFNAIADPDICRGALNRCAALCYQLRVPVINHPHRIQQTTRDTVSELLQGIPGVIMPRTIRCQPRTPDAVFQLAKEAGIDLPFIFRIAGDHGGKSMTLVRNKEDRDSLHAYPFDGRDFYLTEYVDCRGNDGFYQKQRIIVIDGEPVARHALFGGSWNVHWTSRPFTNQNTGRAPLERQMMDKLDDELVPALTPSIAEIRRRLGLEYFGIDCSIRPDGTMLIFEANASMHALETPFAEVLPRVALLRRKVIEMIARYAGKPFSEFAIFT